MILTKFVKIKKNGAAQRKTTHKQLFREITRHAGDAFQIGSDLAKHELMIFMCRLQGQADGCGRGILQRMQLSSRTCGITR